MTTPRSNLPKYTPGQSPIKSDDLNRLRSEVSRQGRIQGSGGIAVRHDSSGIRVSLNQKDLTPKFAYCLLNEQLNAQQSATAHMALVPDATQGALIASTKDQDKIEVWCSPLFSNYGDYVPSGTWILAAFFPTYQRWQLLSTACSGCQ